MPGMDREKSLWICFLWHVIDWPQLELGQGNNLTDFSGCWLPYLLHIPQAKQIDRFGVNVKINLFLGVRLAETEQLLLSCGAWCRVHLPEILQGFQLTAVLCVSSVHILCDGEFLRLFAFCTNGVAGFTCYQRLLCGTWCMSSSRYSKDPPEPNVSTVTAWLRWAAFRDSGVSLQPYTLPHTRWAQTDHLLPFSVSSSCHSATL